MYICICMIGIKRSVHVYIYIYSYSASRSAYLFFLYFHLPVYLYLSVHCSIQYGKNINPAPYIIVFQLGPCSILNHPKPRTGICCSIRFKYSLKIWDVFNPGIILVESLLAPRTNPVTPKLEIEKMSFRLDHRRGCCERTRNVKTSHKMMVV